MTPVPRVLGIREFVDGETKLQNNSSLMKNAYFERENERWREGGGGAAEEKENLGNFTQLRNSYI